MTRFGGQILGTLAESGLTQVSDLRNMPHPARWADHLRPSARTLERKFMGPTYRPAAKPQRLTERSPVTSSGAASLAASTPS